MTMKITVVGGGPGGLFAALLLKKSDPSREIEVIDRNRPDATYGWGVVFSDETLGFLEEADRPTFEAMSEAFIRWEAIDVTFRGTSVRCGGHAFSGIGRARLLNILQKRCATLGIHLSFEREAPDVDPTSADLIIAADGVNSALRTARSDVFRPSFDTHGTRFIWLGAELPLDAFTFIFRETEWGIFQVHAYPFSEHLATFIVETTEDAWQRAGLDGASEGESLEFCARIFEPELQGAPLLSNRSSWIRFVTLRNETWHHKNVVLLGDAAHTAHFTVGSGTKMAMEDAIALDKSLAERPGNLSAALVQYEELRSPLVERTQTAARESSRWFEQVARRAHFEPVQFAFSLLTRSKRVTYDNLRRRDPAFAERVNRWFAVHATGTPTTVEPLAVSLRLNDQITSNRLVVELLPDNETRNGIPSPSMAQRALAGAEEGAGVIVTELLASSADGLISPISGGLFCEEQADAWRKIVAAIHARTQTPIAAHVGHAGRRGAVRATDEGADRPLRKGGWPLLSASPLPYTPDSQIPRAMDREDMDRVLDEFVAAARRADRAGFDILLLSLGHGYLLGSFLSPLSNQRRDCYGGSLENRLRFPTEVVRAVREVWPKEKVLAARISVTDWKSGGLKLHEGLELTHCLRVLGCDLIDVVSGQTTPDANPPFGQSWQARLSDRVRNEVGVPTMVGGQVTTANDVNTILASGQADLCIVTLEPRSALLRRSLGPL